MWWLVLIIVLVLLFCRTTEKFTSPHGTILLYPEPGYKGTPRKYGGPGSDWVEFAKRKELATDWKIGSIKVLDGGLRPHKIHLASWSSTKHPGFFGGYFDTIVGVESAMTGERTITVMNGIEDLSGLLSHPEFVSGLQMGNYWDNLKNQTWYLAIEGGKPTVSP